MHASSSKVDDAHAINDALVSAIAVAGYAPSIDNTQPWRWRLDADTVDLYLERSRVQAATDPDLRQAILSCGAALHHVRTVLAAEGWRAEVTRMPDAADQDHLAHLQVEQAGPPDPDAVRHVRTIPLRQTNRRPVTGAPVGSDNLRAITASVQAEGAWLQVLHHDQILELVVAAGRDDGGLAVGVQDDRAALFAILYGRSDEPRDWLRAGEALSAGWLTATERGISVLPFTAPVAAPASRDIMRRHLSYLNHPFLVLRLGTVDAVDADASHAPRHPADQIVQRP
jgi:hypothetical protein